MQQPTHSLTQQLPQLTDTLIQVSRVVKGCPALALVGSYLNASTHDSLHVGLVLMQEELVFHIQHSEAKQLKATLRSTLQQQAGISASITAASKHT